MLYRGLETLAELALTQPADVLDAYASRSVQQIIVVRDRDDEIDAMYTSLFRELLTYMMEDPRTFSPARIFCSAQRISAAYRRSRDQYCGDRLLHRIGLQMPAERPKEDLSHGIVADEARKP